MKKRKCAICQEKKARRKCERHNDELICSECCAELRDSLCENCQYYNEAKQYESSKKKKKRNFIVEINEEVEESVDNALELVERGKIRKGEQILIALKIRYPDNYKVNYGMGVVHALKNEYDNAIKYFTKATDAFPYFTEAHFNKGMAYRSKYDIKNAVRSFRELIEIGDPQGELVSQAREFISGLESQVMETNGITLDRYFEAQEIFEKAFSLMERGAWQDAIKNFQKCIRLNEKHPQSYGNLGLCYAQLGQKQEAITAFDKAIEIDPNYEPAMVNKVMVKSLKDGEKLSNETFKSIDYYKDYSLKKKSFTQEILNELLGK